MSTMTIFTPALSCPLKLQSSPYLFTHASSYFIPTSILKLTTFRSSSSAIVRGGRSTDPKETAFLDDNGVIEDMDGYLNYLSLEYDSVWDTKPSWCQPWTITLTGIIAVVCSWLVLRSVAVTASVSFLIAAWWYIFLYNYPKAYSSMIAERRKKITDGVEDTYGSRK
ncbi:uncharacterized protein LOC124921755 [Impatiens glandulifera]|uniref:uncharacterized protein LOC124921755 n=1 Tax=Impatiens glandulifera TaxID=253017 RepID=UPI001FB110DB|nr:uncharacterized protein LOC124921755 [Impatiens glandulifera]